MIRFLTYVSLALLTLGVVCLPAGMANPVVGQVYDGYFTYGSDGYFHYGDSSYSRYLVSNPGYYSYGYYYPGSSYYKYTRVATVNYNAVQAPAYSANWKSEAIGAGVKLADMELYYKTLKALGLNGQSYPFQAGGYAYNFSGYSSPALSSAGYAGNTNFGYGVANVTAQYGSLDVNRTLAQAYKLGQGAQDYARESTGQLTTLTGDITGGMQRVAETLAKGQAAAQVLKSAEAPPSSVATTVTTGGGAAAGGNAGNGGGGGFRAGAAVGGGGDDLKAFLANVATPDCASCHSGADPKGKFDIIKEYQAGLSAERRAQIWLRLVIDDPEKRMPRTADGKPGAVTQEHFVEFARH